MRRITVLANRGSGAPADDADRLQSIVAAFKRHGVAPDVHCVAGHELSERARSAATSGAELVVAAGGDGTVGTVAGALAATGVPLGVLPLGTLNHFAKDLGIPLNLEGAVAVALNGIAKRIDVGEVNGQVFVNNSSIGIYPRTVRERERRRRRDDSKRVATLKAAWKVLQRLPRHRVVLAIDGRPVLRTTSFVFVGNNVYQTGFGSLGQRARLDAGVLGVYHVLRPGRRAVLGLVARALVGRLDAAPTLASDTAHVLSIASSRPRLRVALDGEITELQSPLLYRIRPGELVVRVPEA